MIAKDYERAVYSADSTNRLAFWAIAIYINKSTPFESRGSYRAIEMWRDDVGGRRSSWVKDLEKQKMWSLLKETT